jgi:hypothetical protein
MEFIRTTYFEKRAKEIGFTEDDVLNLEVELMQNPEAGDMVKGSGGLRKIRCPMVGRGKSGGARALYFYVISRETILLFSVLAKNEGANFSKEYLKQLANALKEQIK